MKNQYIGENFLKNESWIVCRSKGMGLVPKLFDKIMQLTFLGLCRDNLADMVTAEIKILNCRAFQDFQGHFLIFFSGTAEQKIQRHFQGLKLKFYNIKEIPGQRLLEDTIIVL